jgi:hypothetical protein
VLGVGPLASDVLAVARWGTRVKCVPGRNPWEIGSGGLSPPVAGALTDGTRCRLPGADFEGANMNQVRGWRWLWAWDHALQNDMALIRRGSGDRTVVCGWGTVAHAPC